MKYPSMSYMGAAMMLLLAGNTEAQRAVAVESGVSSTQRRMDELLARLVSVDLKDVTLSEAITSAAVRANVLVQFQEETLAPYTKRVTLRVTKAPLGVVLSRMLEGTALRVRPDGTGQLVVGEDNRATARVIQGAIVGVVRNAKTKQPVAGVRVLVGDTQAGTTTGEDGTFRLSLEAGEQTIHFRGLGYGRQTRRVTVKEGETVTLEMVLESSASVLDEVIVTGTVVATERKKIATPITVITAEYIERRGITRITELFHGEVPGIYASDPGLQGYSNFEVGAMAKTQVYVRGSADLNGGDNPLKTYIDGVEILEGKHLGTIDPRTIERIEIITGPQAASIYGSGAMGGVMQIFTKRGRGTTTPEVSLDFRYGILENNVATGKTPTHNDAVTVRGGVGSILTYSGTVSYNYSGEWQPGLFERLLGGALGISLSHKSLTISASANTSSGENGTALGSETFHSGQYLLGEWGYSIGAIGVSSTRGTSSTQTFSLSADQILHPTIRHSGTVGINYNSFALLPKAPDFRVIGDTLFTMRERQGARATGSYNMTIQSPSIAYISSMITLGGNYSSGHRFSVYARSTTATATTQFVESQIERPYDETSWGYFAQWRIGLFQSMYWTLGMRAELNPAWGSKHKIDWVPANGLAYNITMGDINLKLLASYGRATRVPSPDMKAETRVFCAECIPESRVWRRGNELLTPEYSRGPQGGFELYWGSLGSFSLNTYRQKVDNLIQNVVVDSNLIRWKEFDVSMVEPIWQYQNTASMTQRGWETTGSVKVGWVALNGSYSWMDARISYVNPQSDAAQWLFKGETVFGAVSHVGSINVSVAHQNTSIALISNWTGATNVNSHFGNSSLAQLTLENKKRIALYQMRKTSVNDQWNRLGGFWRSDLSLYQRLSPRLSFTLNIKNISDSYTAHTPTLSPILGRISTFGASYRW